MLFKVSARPIYEMLSCCKVIYDLQNIFKHLTDDSIDMQTTVRWIQISRAFSAFEIDNWEYAKALDSQSKQRLDITATISQWKAFI